MEINTPRTRQGGAIDFFSALSENPEIPIVVIGMKKDEFWDMQYGKACKAVANLADRDAYADEQLRLRMGLIEEEFSEIKNGRYDIAVAVSKGKTREPVQQSTNRLNPF